MHTEWWLLKTILPTVTDRCVPLQPKWRLSSMSVLPPRGGAWRYSPSGTCSAYSLKLSSLNFAIGVYDKRVFRPIRTISSMLRVCCCRVNHRTQVLSRLGITSWCVVVVPSEWKKTNRLEFDRLMPDRIRPTRFLPVCRLVVSTFLGGGTRQWIRARTSVSIAWIFYSVNTCRHRNGQPTRACALTAANKSREWGTARGKLMDDLRHALSPFHSHWEVCACVGKVLVHLHRPSIANGSNQPSFPVSDLINL